MSVTEGEEIVRLAARGDGVTSAGRHVSGAVPGDRVTSDGDVITGSNHVDPSCSHFGQCGGCQLQHGNDHVLEGFVRQRVVNAASGQGVESYELLPTHLSPPKSRRRATLHALRIEGGAVVGFREGGTHRIVDLNDCAVLVPDLAQMVPPLRALVANQGPKGGVDIGLTMTDQGVDVALSHFPVEDLSATEAVRDFAEDHSLARLSIDQGYGPETVWEPEPVSVTLAGIPVPMPVGAFLQATRDAEKVMISDAQSWIEGSAPVADLFAGLGTFSFALKQGRKVLAVEADRAAHLACKSAAARTGGQVLTLHRDLFRNPLQASELSPLGGVLLDPPRAGAKAQIAEIAASALKQVVYVSCNPSSWARDAATLVDAGFRLEKLRPVGQFRWSTHVELVSLFLR